MTILCRESRVTFSDQSRFFSATALKNAISGLTFRVYKALAPQLRRAMPTRLAVRQGIFRLKGKVDKAVIFSRGQQHNERDQGTGDQRFAQVKVRFFRPGDGL